MLSEAAELEHGIMCCYLYCAFSMKRDVAEGVTEEQLKSIQGWRKTIMEIAVEEMLHMCLACNLLTAVGGAAHLRRPNLPSSPRAYPPSFRLALAPFCRESLATFVYIERPLDLVEEAFPEIHGPNQIEWFAGLEREHDNLRAALAWGLELGVANLAQRTAAALWRFWIVCRHVAEGVEWFDRVLALEGGPSKAGAFALLQAGFVSIMVRIDDLEGCRAQIREARTQFVELGEAEGVMTTDSHDAVMQWGLRDFGASSRVLAKIQAIHRSNGFEWGDGFCGWFLGSAAWLSGDITQAGEHYSRSLEIYRRVGDYTFIAWRSSHWRT